MNHKQPTQRRGLGRGLGSLIPTGPPEQAGPRAEEQHSTTASGSYVGAHSAVSSAVQAASSAIGRSEVPAAATTIVPCPRLMSCCRKVMRPASAW